MSDPRIAALREALASGVGADVVVEPESSGLRSGLRSYFEGLTPNQGPLFSIAPAGLTRHKVKLVFGRFSMPLVDQVRRASSERQILARALVEEAARRNDAAVTISLGQALDDWTIDGPDFVLEIVLRQVENPASEEAVVRTAQKVMVPLMAAMAELIGYDEAEPEEFDVEGRISIGTMTRRERSPRNRLLCLSIHGSVCAVCDLDPTDLYGEAGSIIEVHHLESVSSLSAPRPYDPRTDLVPLCPNCHRAVHRRKPNPYSPAELKQMLADRS